jgi:hypothetical protein
MKASIDTQKLLSQAPPVQAQPPANQDANLAQLISSQILAMQKQMERGFGLMTDKINMIEGRVENASTQLE